MRERRFAFVLRLWIEHGDLNDAPVLRGSLQAAEAEQVRYFNTLDDVPALLREWTGWRESAQPGTAAHDSPDK